MSYYVLDQADVGVYDIQAILQSTGIQDLSSFVDDFRQQAEGTVLDDNFDRLESADGTVIIPETFVQSYIVLNNQLSDDNKINPQVVPNPVTPEVRPDPVTPEVRPNPVSPEVRPNPVTPEVRPNPVPPQVRPNPVPPQVRPNPVPPQVDPRRPIPPPENAQKAFDIVKKYDRNGDGKIVPSDIEAVLKELGVGAVSSPLAKALFEAIDKENSGSLDPTELMALAAILDKLSNKPAAVPPTR